MAILLIDGNSVGHASNSVARLTAGDIETQAIFGVINSVHDLMVKHAGCTPICLWDGRAQWRYDIYPGYKANRNVDPDKVLKPYEVEAQRKKASYQEQKPFIVNGLKLLGVRQIIPENDEADDLAGYLAKHYSAKGHKVLLISRDHDWLQLVDKNISWFNPFDNETVTHKTFQEYTGYKEPIQFVSEKCLVGDSSDTITGVSGIGKASAPLIIHHYGSVERMLAEVLAAGDSWVPPTPELRRYKKKILDFAKKGSEGRAVFERNLKLMSLLNVEKPSNLKVTTAALDQEGFVDFCRSLGFHSIIRKLDVWLQPFKN